MRSRLGFFAALFAFAIPAHAYRIAVWVPAWDPNAVTIMQAQAGKVDESNPGWYVLAADGGVAKNWGAEDPNLRAALSGTALVPTIKNYVNGGFDSALVARVISTPTGREQHAEALTRLVVENAFDGIDIDYELVPTSSRDHFTAFIQLLSTKLHGAGKVLSVTLAAKTSETQTWDGPGGNDWPALGLAADTIKIMAYDKHYNGSKAGAITPLDWLDSVVRYATSVVAPDKIIVGLPWYGYDWAGTQATGITHAAAVALANSKGATISRDVNSEATFTYDNHVVYFQDVVSYKAKVDMLIAKHPAIGGFAHWRVGAEDPAIWGVVANVREQGRQTTTVATPAGVVATAVSSSAVQVGWNAVSGAARYEVRRNAGGGYGLVATVTTNSITDSGLIANKSYLYTVRAITSGGQASADAAPDVATTTVFSDDPLSMQWTVIKATHLQQLRTAVNAMRSLAGLPAAQFTDATTAGSTIRAIHVTELRTALSSARSTLALPTLATGSVTQRAVVRAADFSEIRAGVR